MRIISIDPDHFKPEAIKPAVQALENGEVIIYPTETVYGLGATIYSPAAVQKVFALKKRDAGKPVSCMIKNYEDVQFLCKNLSRIEKKLMQTYWPGPVSFVCPARDDVPKMVLSGKGKIGLRMPDHPVTSALMRLHPQPVISTSVNLSGEPPAITIADIPGQIKNNVAVIIDAGPCRSRIPSTVVELNGEDLLRLRSGVVAFEQIKETFDELKKAEI